MENQEIASESENYDEVNEFKEYKTPVNITNRSNSILITWTPLGILYSVLGDKESSNVVEVIKRFIDNSAVDGYIKVTPEGPSFPATTSNLYTVMWAAYSLLGPSVYVEGGGPTMFDLGISKDDEQDPDGNPLVR